MLAEMEVLVYLYVIFVYFVHILLTSEDEPICFKIY